MLLKLLKSLFLKKKINKVDELKVSLTESPYNHITVGPGLSIKKGEYRGKGINNDFHIYVDAKKQIGLVMTLERVTVSGEVAYIQHLSVHSDFRKKGLGKPCVDCFISFLKNEKNISKVIFSERLGNRVYYQRFFNQVMNASPVEGKNDNWELEV